MKSLATLGQKFCGRAVCPAYTDRAASHIGSASKPCGWCDALVYLTQLLTEVVQYLPSRVESSDPASDALTMLDRS